MLWKYVNRLLVQNLGKEKLMTDFQTYEYV